MPTISLRPCHRQCRPVHRDRAAIVASTLMLVIDTAPKRRLRQQIEQILRDELEDERRQAAADRELSDA
jgi:hypothetical protein